MTCFAFCWPPRNVFPWQAREIQFIRFGHLTDPRLLTSIACRLTQNWKQSHHSSLFFCFGQASHDNWHKIENKTFLFGKSAYCLYAMTGSFGGHKTRPSRQIGFTKKPRSNADWFVRRPSQGKTYYSKFPMFIVRSQIERFVRPICIFFFYTHQRTKLTILVFFYYPTSASRPARKPVRIQKSARTRTNHPSRKSSFRTTLVSVYITTFFEINPKGTRRFDFKKSSTENTNVHQREQTKTMPVQRKFSFLSAFPQSVDKFVI